MVVTSIDCVLPLAVDDAEEAVVVASTMAAIAGRQRRRVDDPFIFLQQSPPYAKYILDNGLQ